MASIPQYTRTEIRRRAVADTTDPTAVQSAVAPYQVGAQLSAAGSEMAFNAAEQIKVEQQKNKQDMKPYNLRGPFLLFRKI